VFLLALAYVVLAFATTMTWHIPSLARFMPKIVADLIYPIDKTNLDILRFIHFLALAVITVRLIPRGWPGLESPLLRPAILCGQHSLEIFCLGVFLSFTGHFFLMEISDRVWVQFAVTLAGIIIMVAVAALMRWYRSIERRPGPRPPRPDASLAGGEA
jgi:hypothetical protein